MKKLFSILMSVIMIFSMIPTITLSSFAANDNQNSFEELLSSIDETEPENEESQDLYLGDVNGDGTVKIVDAKWILQNIAELKSFNATQSIVADVNKDGQITIVDAKWVLQCVAGLKQLSVISDGVDVLSGNSKTVDIFSISDIEITDYYTIKATVSAPKNCALVIRFIDEDYYFSEDFNSNEVKYIDDGNVYASQLVKANSDEEIYECNIINSLPEKYVAQAVLLNSSGEELCTPYSCIDNTLRHEEFDKLTVDDFSEKSENVVNFDTSKSNNFGVLAEDVIIATATYVQYDISSNTYVIGGCSTNFRNGDKVYIETESEDFVFRAKEVSYDGGAITVLAATADDDVYGYELTDFYDFIKVDFSESDSNESEPLEKNINVADIDINPSVKYAFPVIIDTENIEVEYEASGTLSAEVVIEWDIKLFGKDYFKCEVITTQETENKIGVKLKAENEDEDDKKLSEKEEDLGKIVIPTGIPGLDIYADVKLKLDWEISVGFEATGKTVEKCGFKFNTKDGSETVESKENTWSVDIKGHAEIEFGPEFNVGIQFMAGIVKAHIEMFLGVKVEVDLFIPIAEGGTYIHSCDTCLDGVVSAVLTIKVKLDYNILDTLKGTPIDITLLDKEFKLFDFYFSIFNDVNSMFGGKMKFGIGDCPNKSYKTNIIAVDENYHSLSDIEISVFDETGEIVKGKVKSQQYIYLPIGNYQAKAVIDGQDCKKTFNVVDAEKDVTVSVNDFSSVVKGNIYDANSKYPLENAKISIYDGTIKIATTTSNENGDFSFDLEPGFYTLKANADKHVSTLYYFSVEPNEVKFLDAIYLADENSSIMGGVFGEILDAKTGYPVENAKIIISKGWGYAATENTKVCELYTDENGIYNEKKTSVFDIDFGLDAGNYMVSVEKEGYISTSFNITIVGGCDKEFNSTITPIGSENEYYISLTWGDEPSDLDSHLNAIYDNNREHVYYSERIGEFSELDVDDTSSYGPETITIFDINSYSGNVMYSVHDYTNRYSTDSDSLSKSGATVSVYKGDELLKTYYVPTNNEGTVWNVFYFDENHEIVDVNSFDFISEPNSVTGYPGLGDYN